MRDEVLVVCVFKAVHALRRGWIAGGMKDADALAGIKGADSKHSLYLTWLLLLNHGSKNESPSGFMYWYQAACPHCMTSRPQ